MPYIIGTIARDQLPLFLFSVYSLLKGYVIFYMWGAIDLMQTIMNWGSSNHWIGGLPIDG